MKLLTKDMKSYMEGADVAELISMLQTLLITSLDEAVCCGDITCEQRRKIIEIIRLCSTIVVIEHFISSNVLKHMFQNKILKGLAIPLLLALCVHKA